MKASTETLRRQNRALVLSALRRLGNISHTEISSWTGLSSATVSTITTEMEKENIILRVEQAPKSGRGRPRIALAQNPASAYVAAIRITGDLVEYSLVDYAGTLKDRFNISRPPEEQSAEIFAARFKSGLEQLTTRSQITTNQLLIISITTKGLVASGKPELLWSPIFDDTSINFEELLKPEWSGQVRLTNDTQFAAQSIANSKFEQRSGSKLATLSLDHSIGLGIATQDQSGTITSFAPPFGHMIHTPEGPICRCGSHGCIESHAGFYGILRTAFEVDKNTIPAKLIPIEQIEQIANRARQGDHLADYAFRMAGDALGIGISRLLTLFGNMPITITGPGLKFYDLMEASMRSGIEKNLQIRYGEMPDISLHENEGVLIFNGNIQTSLADLDLNIISERNRQR